MSRHVLIVDVETAPREECRQWVRPAGNLKDPVKIAASIEERADRLAVDINGARIVVLGWWDPAVGAPITVVCHDEQDERSALDAFWRAWSQVRATSADRLIAGFYCRVFDLPLIIRRSQLLGVTPGRVSLARYGRGDVLDLYDELTFHEHRDGVVPCSLDVFCQQFGIKAEDTIDGKDVPALVAEGSPASLDLVRRHNEADLLRVGLLGERLGYFARIPALA